MAKATPLRASFNAGELNPRLAARSDFDKYKNGCEVLENMIPIAEGGAIRRPGTRYVAEVKDSTADTRIGRFIFSTTQAYPIEKGDEYYRFFRNQGQIEAGDTDGAFTNGGFTGGSSGWTDYSTDGTISTSTSDNSLKLLVSSSSDIAAVAQTITVSSSLVTNEHVIKFQIKGPPGRKLRMAVGASSSQSDILTEVEREVGYHAVPMTPNSTSLNVRYRLLGSDAAITVSSSLNTPTYYLYLDDVELLSGGVLEIQSPFPSSVLYEVEGPQSADVLYQFNNGFPPHKLTRAGHTNWSMVRPLFTDGPYLDINDTATTIAVNCTDGRYVLATASTTTGINDGDGFGSNDVHRLLRMSTSSTPNWGWAIAIESTSTTTLRVDVQRDFPSTGATTEWRLGAWYSETGWPGVGTFHQQRLVVARTNEQPQTKWYSQTGDFENHTPDSASSSGLWNATVQDDDAMAYTISADDVDAIEWMTAGTKLQVGTRSGEWEVTSNGSVIIPTDIEVLRHTKVGSARIQPARVGHTTLFVQRAKRDILELAFSFEVDGLVANPMTRLSKHITVGGVKELAYQAQPHSVVWAPRTDGQLLSMTYRRDEDVVGWGRHIMGGVYSSSVSPGHPVVDSVTTIPGSTASGQTEDSIDRDEVWMVVKRTINGSTVRYVEFMEGDWETGDNQADAYYSDSLLTYSGSSVSSITGYSHIGAATAKVFANGSIQSDQTVSSSGVITLDEASTTVQAGLGYTHRLRTLKFDVGSMTGTAQGQLKRIREINYILNNSLTLEAGASSSQLTHVDFREVGDEMDTAPDMFTGVHALATGLGWDEDPRVYVESDDPVPFELPAVAPI